MKAKIALLSSVTVVMFAVMMLPSVAAYTGSMACLSPASCKNANTLNLTGPGSTATATFWLYNSNAPSGTTITYYVCPSSASSCSSDSGTNNGWSWSFTPASGTVGSGSPCNAGTTCEGNGVGSPNTLTLTLTAPTTVTSGNMHEELTIYACSQSGGNSNCASLFQEVASLTIDASVPQFGLGMGLALVVGLFGLLFFARRKGTFSVPSTHAI